jgi:DNA replication protein DnaC
MQQNNSHNITLPFLLKELKLSGIRKIWEEKTKLANNDSWQYEKYLSILMEEEIASRYHSRTLRYIRESKLPINKTLSNFNFENLTIDKQKIINLSNNDDWVKNSENILLFGPSGVGKTHLASAIARSMIEKGFRVKFSSTIAMMQQLQKAKRDLTLMDELSKLDKYKILILDDIGYVKKSESETSLLFELIGHRYESGSLIITANQPFSKWDEIFRDNMMTVAAIDRLIHHCSIIQCDEESFRRKESIEKLEGQNSSNNLNKNITKEVKKTAKK